MYVYVFVCVSVSGLQMEAKWAKGNAVKMGKGAKGQTSQGRL